MRGTTTAADVAAKEAGSVGLLGGPTNLALCKSMFFDRECDIDGSRVHVPSGPYWLCGVHVTLLLTGFLHEHVPRPACVPLSTARTAHTQILQACPRPRRPIVAANG